MAPKGVICMLGASTLVLQDPGAILGGSWDIGEPKEEHCDFLFENVRLCVERKQAFVVLPSEASPVQRSRAGSSGDFGRPSGAERARAPMSSAPAEPSGLELGNVGRCSVFEQPGRAISSALAEPSESSEFERPFRAPQRSRAGSSGHFERPRGAERARSRKRRQVRCFRAARPSNFERPGGAERVRAAISSAPAEPSGLERPFRAPQRSRAGSSGHFERPSGAERARAAISSAPAEPSGLEVANVGRCGVFEARPSRVKPGASKACKPSCGNFELVRLCTA